MKGGEKGFPPIVFRQCGYEVKLLLGASNCDAVYMGGAVKEVLETFGFPLDNILHELRGVNELRATSLSAQ